MSRRSQPRLGQWQGSARLDHSEQHSRQFYEFVITQPKGPAFGYLTPSRKNSNGNSWET